MFRDCSEARGGILIRTDGKEKRKRKEKKKQEEEGPRGPSRGVGAKVGRCLSVSDGNRLAIARTLCRLTGFAVYMRSLVSVGFRPVISALRLSSFHHHTMSSTTILLALATYVLYRLVQRRNSDVHSLPGPVSPSLSLSS